MPFSKMPNQQNLNALRQLLLCRKSGANALYKSAILSLSSRQGATEDMRSHSKTLLKDASEVGMTPERRSHRPLYVRDHRKFFGKLRGVRRGAFPQGFAKWSRL